MTAIRFRIIIVITVMAIMLLWTRPAAAHCDSLDGPVIKDARLALQERDVRKVLKWVPQADEAQIVSAFERTLKVRELSADARKLADTYFFETLVRVHRAGEGEPYTGLKAEGSEIEPGIALADSALKSGTPDTLIQEVTSEVAKGLRQRFARVQEARKLADKSVESGRAYVAAYVEFIHYVESVHKLSETKTAPHGH